MRTRFIEGQLVEEQRPFRHLRAVDVFAQAKYQSLCDNFRERQSSGAFHSGTREYDAEIFALQASSAADFSPLLDRAWLEQLAGFFSLPFEPVVDAALHSSPAGSRTGWIHTDHCSAWFDRSEPSSEEGLLFPSRRRCEYFTGTVLAADAQPHRFYRSAALIYYLCNDGWTPGDGGETGLYSASKAGGRTQELRVAPINNSLVAFECSPHSYHRFLANPGRRRNSVILWLHLDAKRAAMRWGSAVKADGAAP